jgi:hypothetical protein
MEMSMVTSVRYVAASERRALDCERPVAATRWQTKAPLFSGIQGGAVSNHSSRPTGNSAATRDPVV